ncbi:MAG TPA: NAD(P)/FAD-dependent oxidoreductase [Casimicrobiaceae bacterium]|nr:NAD(P)/FAD-dependent oxidoreductase [Casimicrobiaceae bacterium]
MAHEALRALTAARTASCDIIVIGAGAAGMMCAAQAGQRGRRVMLIEHYPIIGEKIRISGGGRCNFTNIHSDATNFLSQNPDFCRSALARYGPRDFIALVERYGIAWHEKKLGQLFCDDSALQIIAMLRAECERAAVEWRVPCSVEAVKREHDAFVVSTSRGAVRAASLVVATGGLTVPKIGATPLGYRIAEQFGVDVVAPRPALVPLALDPATLERYGDLSGVSIDAEVSCNGGRFRENLLFTHRGLSGPAILQVSSYWKGGDLLHVDLLPGLDARAWLASERHTTAGVASLLAQRLPHRFAQQWSLQDGSGQQAAGPIRSLGEKRLSEIGAALNDWSVLPSGTLGYNKAEVTLGGVDTRQISSKTMEAERVPGLYFIGEVVDVTGHLGGHNFQWAWSSGFAAGQFA